MSSLAHAPFATSLAISRPALAAFAAMGLLWGAMAADLPDIKVMLGVNEAEFGLLLFASPMAAIVGMLLAPQVAARCGRGALPLAVALMGLAFALPGQISSYWLFPLALMCCGFGTGLTDILMNARVAAMENSRGIPLMNLCHAGYSFGYAGGAMLTGVTRGAGWPPSAVLGSMAAIALGLALVSIDRDGRIDDLRRPKPGTAVGLGWLPLIGGVIVLVAFMTENAIELWSALFIETILGGAPEQGAAAPAIMALTMGVSRLFGQGLAGRMPMVRLLSLGAGLAAVGALIAATAATAAVAYVGFFVVGIGASVIAPTAFSLVGQMAAPEARARAVARATMLGYFGYFIGPPVVGLLAGQFGLRVAFVFAACILATVPLLARLALRR